MKKVFVIVTLVLLSLLTFVYVPTQSRGQKEKFLRKEKKVPNSYIVVLEDWAVGGKGPASIVPAIAAEMASNYRGNVTYTYQHALTGFAVEMSETDAQALSQDYRVSYVEENGLVQATATQNNAPWGLDRIDQRDRPLNAQYVYTPNGTGVHVYIIDTGIRSTHTQFGGRANGNGFTAINDGNGTNDCNGHGTHVAGIVGGITYGAAKRVTLHSIRVLDCAGNGSDATVIGGVDWVAGNRQLPAVANMSLGGGASSAIDIAVQNMISSRVTTAIAAGNDYGIDACNLSPARVPEAITVGATTPVDAKLDMSNIGTCLDLFAPGYSIASSWHTSDTATNSISGTSMAAAYVSGVAALYLENHSTAVPATVRDQIVNTATTNRLTAIGVGSPNRLLYSLLTSVPAVPAACTGGTPYSGALTFPNDFDFQPNGSFYTSSATGQHVGCLVGPTAGADFDLYLMKWNGSSWSTVASATGITSNETITYMGTPGDYRWQIYADSGWGSYNFWRLAP